MVAPLVKLLVEASQSATCDSVNSYQIEGAAGGPVTATGSVATNSALAKSSERVSESDAA